MMMMSISTSSSHVSFERSGSLLAPNSKLSATKENWKKTPVSYKLSGASRLNSLFCLCLIPKLSKSMAQPDCCCRPTWAEINGIVKSWLCVATAEPPWNYLDSIIWWWCPSPLQLRKRPDLSIRTLQNDKAHANNTAVCALWIIHIQDFFCWIEVLFGSHTPWILSVGRGPVKLSELGDFGGCCFAPLTNCQVDSWVVRFSNVRYNFKG